MDLAREQATEIVRTSADVCPESDPLDRSLLHLPHMLVESAGCDGDPQAAAESRFEAIVMAWNAEL